MTITLALIIAITPITASGQGLKPASESEKTLLNKEEIIELMTQAGQLPLQQQKEKIDKIWAAESSKTPRSDFLYCSAFAYLDNYKAQACLGHAYENGTGIVIDLTDAYVWYSIALEHSIEDGSFKEAVEASREHVKQMLQSTYPAPDDYELEELVQEKKGKIEAYSAETAK